MSEAWHELEQIGEYRVGQHDWITESQDHSVISVINTLSPFQMNIYFGDNRNENPQEPGYVLAYPTELDATNAVSLFRELGTRFEVMEYCCYGARSTNSAAKSESKNLDEVLVDDFDLLRVDMEDFALVWCSARSASAIDGKPSLAIMGIRPIDSGIVSELVSRTLDSQYKSLSQNALSRFNQVFEKYAFAQPV